MAFAPVDGPGPSEKSRDFWVLRVWPSVFCEVYQCLKDKFQQATHHYREMKMLCIDSGFELRGVSCLPLQSSPMEMDKCDYSVKMYYVAAFCLFTFKRVILVELLSSPSRSQLRAHWAFLGILVGTNSGQSRWTLSGSYDC